MYVPEYGDVLLNDAVRKNLPKLFVVILQELVVRLEVASQELRCVNLDIVAFRGAFEVFFRDDCDTLPANRTW